MHQERLNRFALTVELRQVEFDPFILRKLRCEAELEGLSPAVKPRPSVSA